MYLLRLVVAAKKIEIEADPVAAQIPPGTKSLEEPIECILEFNFNEKTEYTFTLTKGFEFTISKTWLWQKIIMSRILKQVNAIKLHATGKNGNMRTYRCEVSSGFRFCDLKPIVEDEGIRPFTIHILDRRAGERKLIVQEGS